MGIHQCVVKEAKDFQGPLAAARSKATFMHLPYGKWGVEGTGVMVTVKAENDGLNAYHDGQLIGPLSTPSVRAWFDKVVANGGSVEVPAFLNYSNGWFAVVEMWDQDFR